MAGQFLFEQADDLVPVGPLPLGLLRVETEDIPSPAFAIAEDDLLGVQVVGDLDVAAGLGEHLLFYLGHRGHPGGQQILAAGPGQLFPVVRGVHARVGHKQGAAEFPAAEVLADALDRGDIRGVAGKDPALHRQPFPGDRQGDNDLRGPGALLGMAVLAQASVVFVGVVLVVDGKRSRSGVVENQVNREVEQVGGLEKDRLLDRIDVLVEEVHGLVHLSQFQTMATGKMDSFQPAIPDAQLGLGSTEAVGGHGQQRLVVGDGVLALAEQGSERLADAQSLPQGFNDQHGAEFDRAQNFKIIGQPTAALVSIAITISIQDGDPADPGDGAGKPDQGLAVQLIGPAEAVDDAGNGGVGLRIPHVVSELEVLGDGTVLVLSFRGSQVHGCPPR